MRNNRIKCLKFKLFINYETGLFCYKKGFKIIRSISKKLILFNDILSLNYLNIILSKLIIIY